MLKNILKKILFIIKYLNPNNHKSCNCNSDFDLVCSKLYNYRDFQNSTLYEENRSIEIKYDLHIVVPAYNVEKYIKQCIDSLLNQNTKFTYFITIVNDGSNDKTANILDEYKNTQLIKIISKSNEGLASARNSGMSTIMGKYITFVDSDDMVSENFVNEMLSIAYKKNADVVQTKLLHFSSAVPKMSAKKRVFRSVSSTSLKGYACGSIYKSELFKNINFPKGYLYEDTINLLMLFQNCKIAYKTNSCLYYYRNNPNSLSHTNKGTSKALDTLYITKLIIDNFKFDPEYYDKIIKKQIACNIRRIAQLPSEYFNDAMIYQKEICKTLTNAGVKKSGIIRALLENKFKLATIYAKYMIVL